MGHELTHRYIHVETGLVENVVIRWTTDTDAYPSGWKYTLHLGTVQDLTLIRYDNAHEDTKGHELHTAAGDADAEFPGMEELIVEFWAQADEYWDRWQPSPSVSTVNRRYAPTIEHDYASHPRRRPSTARGSLRPEASRIH